MFIKYSLIAILYAIQIIVISSFAFSISNAASLFDQALQSIQGTGAVTVPPPGSVEVAFSPDGGAADLVIKAIRAAKQTIRVAAYSFTSRPIADALIAAHQKGIDIEIIADHDQLRKDSHSDLPALAAAAIPIHIDIVHALMHDKYMIIDGKTVETGSYNYTSSAEQHNAENVVVLWDAPRLAAAYAQNWQNLWDKAENYSGK